MSELVYIRRFICWLKGHKWGWIEDHTVCCRCWAERDPDGLGIYQ